MKSLIKKILKEETGEIDKKIMNFLLRRFKKEERKLGDFDDNPLIVTEYRFEGLPGYGFNSWTTKKEMEKSIINMLYENNMLENHPYDLDEKDPERVILVKTIRRFLSYVLS